MKQVQVKGGKVSVEEAPPPSAEPGMALVRVCRSLISSGTESGFVSGGGVASLVLKKARDPLNIEKVKRKLASVGVKRTLDLIRNKLFEFQAPGYSASGVIVECGRDVAGFRAGDRVACAGVGYASHAEYNAVPHQLLTPIPDGVSFDEAAFVALGAIAMQGVRRIEPSLGETLVVSGLGLLGQLAAQIARAAGCHVIGCDPIASKRALALSLGAEAVCAPDELAAVVAEWTGGHGADGVVICAASKSSDVTNQALDLCREKGRVVAVGAVGLQLQREPLYLKELDFRLSCSYGPGRYHPEYEEKGLDFPIGHVRWTEGRNMSEFLRLIAAQRVQVKPLISLTVPVGEAQSAYDAILDSEREGIAALIAYWEGDADEAVPLERRLMLSAPVSSGAIGIAVIGAGSYAKGYHLPNLARIPECRLEAVVSHTGAKAKEAAQKFGARYCATDYREALRDDRVNAVLIATRHHQHAEHAIEAARAGKHILLEKPMALTLEDCGAIAAEVEKAGVLLSVGFNRRFSAYARAAKEALRKIHGPKMIMYRMNAGPLPAGHWLLDREQSGGRILGEAVHLFDFCCWLLDGEPVSVRADRIAGSSRDAADADNVSALLRFPDGSLATVIYGGTGHSGVSKERVEIFGGGGAIVIEDFRGVQIEGLPGASVPVRKEDKGQFELLRNFADAVSGKAPLGVTASDGLRATRIALEVLDQCRT